MLVLNENDLSGLLPPSALIDAVAAALRAHSAGSIVAPARLRCCPTNPSRWKGNISHDIGVR